MISQTDVRRICKSHVQSEIWPKARRIHLLANVLGVHQQLICLNLSTELCESGIYISIAFPSHSRASDQSTTGNYVDGSFSYTWIVYRMTQLRRGARLSLLSQDHLEKYPDAGLAVSRILHTGRLCPDPIPLNDLLSYWLVNNSLVYFAAAGISRQAISQI